MTRGEVPSGELPPRSVSAAPNCERCGQPAHNVNRNGEHTGAHRDVEECLRELGRRVLVLEQANAARSLRIGPAS